MIEDIEACSSKADRLAPGHYTSGDRWPCPSACRHWLGHHSVGNHGAPCTTPDSPRPNRQTLLFTTLHLPRYAVRSGAAAYSLSGSYGEGHVVGRIYHLEHSGSSTSTTFGGRRSRLVQCSRPGDGGVLYSAKVQRNQTTLLGLDHCHEARVIASATPSFVLARRQAVPALQQGRAGEEASAYYGCY